MTSTVVAPIVASVWQLHVEPGQELVAGQVVAVLESMKMEIPVISPAGGTVSEIPVEIGQIVQEGEVLVVLA